MGRDLLDPVRAVLAGGDVGLLRRTQITKRKPQLPRQRGKGTVRVAIGVDLLFDEEDSVC